MVLASHNTMTHLKPRKWWMRFGRFMAKCQSKTIQEQYNAGARWFDLRISFYKDSKDGLTYPCFGHGMMIFKGDVEKTLEFLASKDDASCRIVLERGDVAEEEIFNYYVIRWLNDFPNLKVTQIARKSDWKKLAEPNYNLGKPMPNAYASCNGYYEKYEKLPGVLHNKVVSGLLIDDLWPWIYAKLNNKKNIEKYKNEDVYLLIDFI